MFLIGAVIPLAKTPLGEDEKAGKWADVRIITGK